MASYRSTKLKITIGYTLLLAILLFSLVFVHREMEALSAADNQQNLRTESLLALLHEKDRNTIQMLRVLSEANDSLLSASEIEEIISEQDSVITHQRVQQEHRRPVQCMASASFRNPRPDDHRHRQRRRKRNAKDHVQPHRQPYRGGARVQYGRPGPEGLCFPLSGDDSGRRHPSPGSHEQPVRHFAGVGRHH